MNTSLKQSIRDYLLNTAGQYSPLKAKFHQATIDELKEATSFLDEETPTKYRIYYILNDVTEQVKCGNENCNNIPTFKNIVVGYMTYCCHDCYVKDKEYRDEITLNTIIDEHELDIDISINDLKEATKFLGNKVGVSERLYNFVNGISEIAQCAHENCTNKPKYNLFIHGYSKFCCTTCANTSKETQEKKKQTCMEKYGVEYAISSDIVMEKRKKTNLERYGVEHTGSSQIIIDKRKKTNLERYGVENVLSDPKIRSKIEQTMIERYGCVVPIHNEEIKQQIIETNMERYGVPHTLMADEVKEKKRQTMLERYGVECILETEESKAKLREASLKKYGVEHHLLSPIVHEMIRQTKIERFGVPNNMLLPEQRQKARETCLERYGAEYWNQSPERKEEMYTDGKWLRPEDRDSYELYCGLVKAKTNKNFVEYYHMINPEGLERAYDKHHVDHIVSKKECFENGILPWVCSHPVNLHMLLGIENSGKGADCWMTIEELFEKIETFDKS